MNLLSGCAGFPEGAVLRWGFTREEISDGDVFERAMAYASSTASDSSVTKSRPGMSGDSSVEISAATYVPWREWGTSCHPAGRVVGLSLRGTSLNSIFPLSLLSVL